MEPTRGWSADWSLDWAVELSAMCSTVQSWDAAWQLDALQRKGAVAGGEDSRLTASGLDGPWLSYAEETELLESHHVVNLLLFVATRYGPASRALP